LALIIISLNLIRFASKFDHDDWQRGRSIARAGKVLALRTLATDSIIRLDGEVRTSRLEPYKPQLNLDLKASKLVSSCGCGVIACKHAAALLQAYLQESTQVSSTTAQFKQALQAAADSLFVDSKGGATINICLRPSAPPREKMLELELKVFLSDGVRPWVEWHSALPAFLELFSTAQQSFLRSMQTAGHRPEGWFRAPLSFAPLDAVHLARLHPLKPGTETLTAGLPRKAEVQWLFEIDGGQRLSLILPDGGELFLIGTQAYYFDPTEFKIGRVQSQLGPPKELLAAIHQCPRLPAVDPEKFWRSLKARVPGFVPTPNWPEMRWFNDKPQPLLQLSVRADREALNQFAIKRRVGIAELVLKDRNGIFSLSDYRRGRSFVEDGVVYAHRFDGAWLESVIERIQREGMSPALELLNWSGLSADSWLLNPDFEESSLQQVCLLTIPKLRQAGFAVHYAPEFPWSLLAAQNKWICHVRQARDAFEIELKVEIDGEQISLLPILRTLVQSGVMQSLPGNPEVRVPITLPDGHRLAIPAGRLRMLMQTLGELSELKADALVLPRSRVRVLDDLESALSHETLETSGSFAPFELARSLREAALEHVQPPTSFTAALRPYQQHGVNWLNFLASQQLSGVLADDMGLGKTVQVIAHLEVQRALGRLNKLVLIVAPSSVVPNWLSELKRFAPSLSVAVMGRAGKRSKAPPNAQIWLCSYAYLGRQAERLCSQDFSCVVLDEAQQIKNPNTIAARTARKLKSTHRLCLTGTPLENHLGELWSQFDFLLPGLLGSRMQFHRLFRVPIERRSDPAAQAQLLKRIGPFLLRRSKDQVLSELPPKTEMTRRVELSGRQRELYELMRLESLGELDRIKHSLGEVNRMLVISALTRLRQICCDPRLLPVAQARSVRDSAKLELLLSMVQELLREGRRILIYSQFTSMLRLIAEELDARKLSYATLTGETIDRALPVEAFQRGDVPLFLLSLRAGGVGLNLTAADVVIHYDPWWNPAVEEQATDRAHRIGQTKPVFVYKLVVMDSVEERVEVLKEQKRDLLDLIFQVSTQEAPATDELIDLLRA
jgi:superfamily II DNA or RNA helicase